MSCSSGDEGPIRLLPAELLVKIFSYLPPKPLLFSASRVNYQWRTVIHHNLRKMQLVPVHCGVDVTDIDPHDDSCDGTHPMITYSFTVFDYEKPDCKSKLKSCLRANGNWTQLYLTHSAGVMRCEWENTVEYPRPIKADPQAVQSLLKYMKIEAMRFDVRKMGKRTTARCTDERFAHALEFCSKISSRVDIKSLLLSSHSTHFPWCLGPLSLKKLAALEVKYLTLENMMALDGYGEGKSLNCVDLASTRYIHLRVDPTHKQDLSNFLWVDINDGLLSRLLAVHERCLEFRAYSECPLVLSMITAEDMCSFIRGWRRLLFPWRIRSINFNSTVTISEFRTVASRLRLFQNAELDDFPYCRFRAYHPADPNTVLELTVYGNGVSNQWQFRSGYSQIGLIVGHHRLQNMLNGRIGAGRSLLLGVAYFGQHYERYVI